MLTSRRWLNLILWGLGERLDGSSDFRSDMLMVVDLLVWIGIASFLVLEGPSLFITLWALAPLSGQPVYWVGTQFIIGYLMTRGSKFAKKAEPSLAQPSVEEKVVEPGPSEEP